MSSSRSQSTPSSETATTTESRAQSPGDSRKARPVDVQIRGQRLAIRTDHDPEFVRRLAAHIDEKVARLQENAPSVPLSKLLMLASMTVAEELFEAREEIGHLRQAIQERTSAMLDLIEQAESGPGETG